MAMSGIVTTSLPFSLLNNNNKKQTQLLLVDRTSPYHHHHPTSSSSSSSSSSSTHKIASSKLGRSPEKRRVSVFVCSISVKSRFGSSFSRGGAGVLERPTFDQSEFTPATQVEHGGDMGRHKDKRGTGSGDSYRVLLIDDDKHNENLVAKNLPQAVPSVTPDDARRLFHVSQENGVAVVIVTVKEHAEFYAQMMLRRGLQSTIEPDSNII